MKRELKKLIMVMLCGALFMCLSPAEAFAAAGSTIRDIDTEELSDGVLSEYINEESYPEDAVYDEIIFDSDDFLPDIDKTESDDFIIVENTVKGLSAQGKTKEDIVIPDGVVAIDTEAFKNENFKSVVIPASVKRIGARAFEKCSNLATVDIRSIQLEDCAIDGSFGGCSISSLTFSDELKYLPKYLFEGAGFADYDVVIPAGIEKIGPTCFYNASGVKSLTFAGNNLKEIDSDAFKRLTSIKSITIPASVTKIGARAFEDCEQLATVNIQSRQLEDYTIDGSFGGCSISSLTFSDELKYLPKYLFEGAGFANYDVVIPAGIEKIGPTCFYNASGVKSLTFAGNNLKEIDSDAFKKLTSIKSITIPASMTKIGARAFEDCTSLSGVLRIPAAVTNIGNSAFNNCAYECIVNRSNAAIDLPLKEHQTWVDYESGETVTSVKDGIAIIKGSTIDPGEDPVLKYTVTYNANGGTGTVPVDENEYEEGAPVIVLGKGDLAKEGCTFGGWSESPAGTGKIYKEGDTYTGINGNVTLFAVWVENGEVPAADVVMVLGQKLNLKEVCFAGITENIDNYAVDDKKLASVSKGMLSAKKPGTVKVTAQKKIGKNQYETIAECTITILNKPKLKFVKPMTYDGQTMNAPDHFTTADTNTLGATSWESSKPDIVAVDSATGLLTAHKNGTAKITAYFGEKSKAGTLKVSANISVKTPDFKKSEYSIRTGATATLAMKNVNAASDPQWQINDVSIARVTAQLDKKGKPTGKAVVTGLSYGKATLTAVIDGQEYSCTVDVAAPVINKTEMTLKVNQSKTVSLKNTKLKKTDIVWHSNNESVAKVDANGKITAVSVGTAVIYTESGGKRNECTVTVKK
ncbi:MAG: leucine-rich repeat protein [Lachnospiraceae bacterium]|nr:leucine-rich repeat protein [Lachnospiraceae bacterium]